MKPVIFHTEARRETRKAIAHYEEQRENLGRELRIEVEAAIQRLRRNPLAYPLHDDKGTRKVVLRRFPFRRLNKRLTPSPAGVEARLRKWARGTYSGSLRAPSTSVDARNGVGQATAAALNLPHLFRSQVHKRLFDHKHRLLFRFFIHWLSSLEVV